MATLGGGVNPGVFFSSRRRHTISDRDWSSDVCSSDLAGSATVTGNGTYPSSAVTVTQAGRYRWIASYSGDPNNNAVSTSCGDAGETSTVNKATPTLTTSATTSEEHTPALQSRSELACRLQPEGKITFTLY